MLPWKAGILGRIATDCQTVGQEGERIEIKGGSPRVEKEERPTRGGFCLSSLG
ncbi:MAG: hypothetical protein MI923_02665 [Phycisphaerales bacterium]|nr:hypothetical protein [Phycisphaerales bacterium]